MRELIERDDSREWLITYSDMISLLLTFFILLYAMSSLDPERFSAATRSIRSALTHEQLEQLEEELPEEIRGELLSESEVLSRILAREAAEMRRLGERISEEMERKGISSAAWIDLEERGLVIHFSGSVLFERGTADLGQSSRDLLSEVADMLLEVPNQIRIEGHTCDLPITTEEFPSNWELSTRRATAVLRFLVEKGIPPWRVSAAGYGEFRPVVPNENEETRKLNRRVDIVILRQSLGTAEPGADR